MDAQNGTSHAARPATRSRRPGLLRDQRGTASIEAAIMLPVMAICWAGLMLRYDQIERFLHAATIARKDAWVYANGGCATDRSSFTAKVVPECAGNDESSGLGWASALQKVPVVGYFVDSLFGYRFTATAEEPYTEPPLFGGESKTSAYPYRMTCNEPERDAGQVIGQVLGQAAANLGIGFLVPDNLTPINHAADCHP